MEPRSRLLGCAFGCLAGLVCAAAACQPTGSTVRHNLEPTGSVARFATSREAFYKERWIRSAKASEPTICAGFVHKKSFGDYLKYGTFELEMTMEVFLGGEGVMSGQSVADWSGGKLLKTITRKRAVSASNNSYVWCGRLQKGGAWKVGAMRYTFVLRGPERAMDEALAKGVLPIQP